MRLVLLHFIFCFSISLFAGSATDAVDGLKLELKTKKNNNERLQLYLDISEAYRKTNADSSVYYAQKTYDEANDEVTRTYRAEAILFKGIALFKKGNFDEALEYFKMALKYSESFNYNKGIADAYNGIGVYYFQKTEYNLALVNYQKSIEVAKKSGNEEDIAKTIGNVASIYSKQGDYNKALQYYQEALEMADKKNDMEQVALLVNKIGNVFCDKGEYIDAYTYYKKSLEIKLKLGDERGVADAYVNIGNVYYKQGKYIDAIDAHYQSLKINEKNGNKQSVAKSYLTIGAIYKDQKENEKALEFYRKALKLTEHIGDKGMLAQCMRNIGEIYQTINEKTLALEHFNKGLDISSESGDALGISQSLNLLGNFYQSEGDFAKAEKYFDDFLTLALKTDNKNGMAEAYIGKGTAALELKKTKEAVVNCRNGYQIGMLLGGLLVKQAGCECLYKSFSAIGKTDSALHYVQLFYAYRDSLRNNENSKEITRRAFQHDYDKKVLADSIAGAQQKEMANLKHRAESRKQKLYIYMSLGAFIITLILAIGIFTNYRLKQQSNKIIKRQKEIMEEKNAEIMSSIRYAQRIQNALLTSDEHWDAISHEHFVLLKPKDVVSGDFYWAHHFSDNKAIWVAADCTGHGVPGAFMSMLGIGFFNEIVVEDNVIYPNDILNRLRTKIINSLRQKGVQHQQMDGMDLALCLWDKNTNQLFYSGANNPLWIIRNGELIEVKPDKQPVGFLLEDKSEPFSIHEFTLQKGDIIYTFTDGYVDQFGGQEGKKFKYKRFRDLLKTVKSKPMKEQKQQIEDAFELWKGNHDQVDDVCVIGVKVV